MALFNSKTIDCTIPWGDDLQVFPGDPVFTREWFCRIEDGKPCNVSKIGATSHGGTHVDAPLHYLIGGKDISQVDLATLIGPCQVIEIKKEQMEGNLITRKSLPDKFKYDRVIFKSYMSDAPGKFREDETAFSLDAAQHITKCGLKLIGTDSFSVETFGGDGAVHREFLSKDTVIIETMNLSKITPGDYNLLCLPLKVIGGDAAPCRCLLTPMN